MAATCRLTRPAAVRHFPRAVCRSMTWSVGLLQQRAQRLGHVAQAELLGLLHALAVAVQLLLLQLQVEPESVGAVGRHRHLGNAYARDAAEEVDLPGQRARVGEFLAEVLLELLDD